MLPDALLVMLVAMATVAAQQPDPSQDSVVDYAPESNIECPDLSTTSLIRVFTPQNQTLHPEETEFINQRASKVLPDAWNAWLGGDSASHGYKLSDFGGNFPKLGIAIPGGGLRSALYAAGTLNALDGRNDSAKAAGTGGLLQVASYMSGLSGMCYLPLC